MKGGEVGLEEMDELYTLVEELWALQRVSYWGMEDPEAYDDLCSSIRSRLIDLVVNMPHTKAMIFTLLGTIEQRHKKTS
jgi:hypothetical protein